MFDALLVQLKGGGADTPVTVARLASLLGPLCELTIGALKKHTGRIDALQQRMSALEKRLASFEKKAAGAGTET